MIKPRQICRTGNQVRKLRKKYDALNLVKLRRCSPIWTCTRNPAMNSKVYCKQLDRMYLVLKEKYPPLINRNRGRYSNWMNSMRWSCYHVRFTTLLGAIWFPPFQVNGTISVLVHLSEHYGGRTRMPWVLCIYG